MIAEKASDMIKEDWNEVISEATCPETNKHYQESKNSEGEQATKVPVKTPPDLFNETTSLFPHLKDPGGDKTKPVQSNSYLNEKTNIDKSKDMNVVRNESTTKPAHRYPIGVRYPYPQSYTTENPFRQFLYGPQSNYDRVTYGQNLLSDGIGNRPYPYAKRPVKKPSRNIFDSKLGTQGYYDTGRIRDPSYYYETGEVITPKGQKKCKIWLYHDGVKYEVVL